MPKQDLTTTTYPEGFKVDEFLELICKGFSETAALNAIGFPRAPYTLILMRNEDFNKRLQEAFKSRGEIWHSKIVEQAVKAQTDPKEVPGEKLRFEQLKYLAEKDDPDRFGDKKKVETSLAISIMDFRNMSDKQAQQIMTTNPFAVIDDVEFTEITDDGTEAL